MKRIPERTIDIIGEEKLIAILHAQLDHGLLIEAINVLKNSGIRIFEVTMRVPGAADLVRTLSSIDEVILGAGTVLDKHSAERMAKEGVSFIVSPVISEEVMSVCKRNEVAWIPGALTPTEIYRAHMYGADAVKVFPANLFGPGYISSVKKPLGDIKLIPTGGIDPHLAGEFIKAGAHAVGAGSELFDIEALELKDWERLKDKAREYIRYLRF